jgi:hypothetical protein
MIISPKNAMTAGIHRMVGKNALLAQPVINVHIKRCQIMVVLPICAQLGIIAKLKMVFAQSVLQATITQTIRQSLL